MDHKKQDVTDCQCEVEDTRDMIASTQPGNPIKLNWFINSESGKYRAKAHKNDCCISNPLRSVVFILWRDTFTDMQIV